MSTAIAKIYEGVTDQKLELIKKTVAQGATDQELNLFLYDCQWRGVHPLDRLIHFTKRGGKYTPITSIDFMRSRAQETGEYAGSDDAIFRGTPKSDDFEASVTVYRLVQGQRCAFSATARWSEYYSDTSPMWKKMPHTMLAKCAEALALRKGFPQQLAGLYSAEELDQSNAETPPLTNSAVRETEEVLMLNDQQHEEIGRLWRELKAIGAFASNNEMLADLQRAYPQAKRRDDLTEAQAAAYIAQLAKTLAAYQQQAASKGKEVTADDVPW